MSFDGIKVDHGGLEGAAAQLMSTAQKIGGRLDQLDGELAPLKSDWDGNAKAQYQVAKTEWDGAMKDMMLLLQDVSRAVSSSNDEYRAADQRGAGRFGG
ncbi:WXG100 family type VII secretion target [Nocardioides limicola]|uniref:WXG100 family type VII secretion target n=1 Tax=Nocardioides limicola TaxID=2803368 RepID=UPI001EEFCA8C|nr:WXG100 family type VII secretion target [Nocardioides sp. DJM-14]